MSATVSPGVEYTLTLDAAEREELISLLDGVLGETRVEAHRTHTPAYRDKVLQQEALVRTLLEKIRRLGT